MRWASTRDRLEPKVRREADLLTEICLSHAENVAYRATRGVANDYQAAFDLAEADDSLLAIVFARVLNFNSQPSENSGRVLEVEATIPQGSITLVRIVGDRHRLLYIQ
jgi:hypothetical protein